MRSLLLPVVVASMVGALPAACQTSQPAAGVAAFNADSASRAVTTLARLLEANFVYPDRGKAYAAMLRENLAAGAYAQFEGADAFTKRVTGDLQAVNPEGHLRLMHPGESPANSPAAGVPNAGEGVVHAGWAAPGVAYISVHGYQGSPGDYRRMMGRLRAVLDTFSTARTLIVDARYYLGGAVEETDIVASYLFGDSTTLLEFDTRLEVEQRGMNPLTDGPALRQVPGPEGIVRRRQIVIPVQKARSLRTAKVYILTSRLTASGGEGFTLALKRTGRATLIGQRTAGAGHFGRMTSLGGGYRAFIPIGRPFDPTTGQGWELTGIEPDVSVPAERALDEALRRAGVDPAAARRALDLPKDYEARLRM